nr:putative protein [Melanopsichium pennsylvanicum 4]
MPGYNNNNNNYLHNPGRSAPVRGVASQQASTTSTSSTSYTSAMPDTRNHVAITSNPSPLPSSQPNNPQHQTHPFTALGHPIAWDRPYSSGVPAPAVAVPIFRAAHIADVSPARHANTGHLPDSPPDTPPHSPGLRPVRQLPFVATPTSSQPQRMPPQAQSEPACSTQPACIQRDSSIEVLYTGQTPCDSELESNADTDISDASDATLDQLTQAAQSLLLRSDSARTKSHRRTLAHEADEASFTAAHRNALSAELMPATPEISPDNDVRHHAQKSAQAFLHRMFDNVSQNLAVEDAGVELISPGWSGAVIKAGPASAHASSSFSSMCSSDSSADAQRTLYVSMPPVVDATLLREQVLAVLDAASEKLGCDSVMVCLDRAMRDFASVVHGLCYVGGALVAAAKETRAEQLSSGQNKLPNADPISNLQLRAGLVLVAIEL